MAEAQYRLDNPIESSDSSRDDCGGTGPDVGCDGVCFSGLALDDCGVCDGGNADMDCSGECGGSSSLDDCGVCDGGNADMDCAGACFGDSALDDCGVCDGDGSSYDYFDVTDVVALVEAILGNEWISCSDINGDGSLDISDIVQIVEAILGSSRIADATEVTLINSGNSLELEADGFVGGIQMTLSHSDDFTIELTRNSMVSDYRTSGTQTVVIIAAPDAGELFTASSEFVIEDVTAATSGGNLSVNIPVDFGLSSAYPNPFNPSTSFDVYMSSSESISLDVYNVMGQLVYTIHSGELTSGKHTFNWNPSNVSSGVYFIKATTASNVATQKVLLMK